MANIYKGRIKIKYRKKKLKSIDVFDSVTVLEDVTVRADLNIDVFESAVGVTDAPTVELPVSFSEISEFDTTTVTDVPTVLLPDALEISISEPLITVTDVVTDMAQELVPSVFDETGVTDVPTVDVLGPTLEINIAEPVVTVTDVPTVYVAGPTLKVDVFDGPVTVTDVVTDLVFELVPSVFDEVTVTDVVDNVEVDLNLSVFDESTVTDEETVSVDLNISEFESTGVTDVLDQIEVDLNISEFDQTTVTEWVDLAQELVLSVFDQATVEEDVTAALPDALEISIAETIVAVTDVPTVDVQDAAVEDLDIDVFDTVTVTDVVDHIGLSGKWWTTFSEYGLGIPGDWTERWNLDGADSEIIVSTGRMSNRELFVDLISGEDTAISWDAVGTPRNIEVLVLLKMQGNNSHCITIKGSGAEGAEYAYYVYGHGSINQFYLRKKINGVDSGLDAQAVSLTAGYTYWVRFQAIGGLVRAKIWSWSGNEPGWQVSAADDTVPEGWAGVHNRSTGDSGALFYSVGTYGEAPIEHPLINESDTVTVTDVVDDVQITVADLVIDVFDAVTVTDAVDEVACNCPGWDEAFDSLDNKKWLETDNNNILSIESNKLHWEASGAGDKQGYIRSRFVLTGDFDIKLDFDVVSLPIPAASVNYACAIQVGEGRSWYAGVRAVIGRHAQTIGTINGYFIDGSSDSWTRYTKNDSSGKLRIKRVGSTLTAWEWDSGQNRWEWNGATAGYTFTTVTAADLYIILYAKQESGSTFESNADNFTITSGCASVRWWEYLIDEFETVTVTDVETVAVVETGVYQISEFDTTTVTDDVTVILPDSLEISVSDTTTVTDVETVSIWEETLAVSVFDTTTVTEYVELAKELTLSVFDGTAVTDEETVQVEAGPALEIDVYDAVTVTEDIDNVCWVAPQDGIKAVTGTFASPLATGTQKIAHGLGSIPAAIIIFTSMVEKGAILTTDGSKLSKGFMDNSGNEFMSGYMSENTADPTNTRCWSYDNKIIFMEDLVEGTLLDAECGATAWTDSHFYIDWNTVDSTQYRIAFVVIAGVAAKVGSFTQRAGTGFQDVTVGWKPNLIMFLGGADDVNTPQNYIRWFHGFANDQTLGSFSCLHAEDNVGTTNPEYWAGYFADHQRRCIVRIDESSFSSTPEDEAEIRPVGNWPSDGFQLDWIDNDGLTLPVGYLAIEGVESYTYYVSEPTGTPPQDLEVTGAGFEPEFLAIVTPGYTFGGVTGNAVISIGFARTPQYEVGAASCDALGKSAGYGSSRTRSDRIFERIRCENRGLRSSAELKSLDADGFTLTYQTTTDISSHPFIFLVMRLTERTIDVYEGVTVQESVTVSVSDPLIDGVFDTTTVTDLVYVELVNFVDVYEDVTVQEDVTVRIDENVSLFDGVTVAEDVTVSLPDALLIDVFDGVTSVDEPTVYVGIIQVHSVSVYDEVTVADVATTVLPDALEVLEFDTVTVTEFVDTFTLNYFVSVFDNVTVSELVEVAPQLKIDVFDTTTVTDSAPVALDDLEAVAFDTISVTDTVGFFIPNFGINVFETVTVGENVGGIIGTVILSTFDNVTVTEYIDLYWIVSEGIARMEITERAPDIEFEARVPRIDYEIRS